MKGDSKLLQARQFEKAGVDPRQAEAITRVMSEMMDQMSRTMGDLYVCKMELEKVGLHPLGPTSPT